MIFLKKNLSYGKRKDLLCKKELITKCLRFHLRNLTTINRKANQLSPSIEIKVNNLNLVKNGYALNMIWVCNSVIMGML